MNATPFFPYHLSVRPTNMASYQPLPDSSEELLHYVDEATKDLVPSGLYHPPFSPQKKASTLLKLTIALSLILSVSLTAANVWASQEMPVSLARVLPVPNVMQLERADQYDGLSDVSRRKLYYHGEEKLPVASSDEV
ncbi:hypothetical protein BC835DRAFT_1421533 [Cytidiella melzeri]|nr:hypothetical protein BC835DRAFT_1421533 [Cytidiella melzeri]